MENEYCKWKVQQEEEQHQQLLEAQRRNRRGRDRQLLQSQPSKELSGTGINLVIPFIFHDHVTTRTPMDVQELDTLLFNGKIDTATNSNVKEDENHSNNESGSDGHGTSPSVREYFLQQPYGKYDLISEVTSWVTIEYEESQCAGSNGNNGANGGYAGLTSTLHRCLEAALEQVSQKINLPTILGEEAEADGGGTGGNNRNVASVTFVHTGYAAEFGGNDPDGTYYLDRIWSHSWEIDTPYYKGRYAIISDKYGRTNNHINRVGVAVHETSQVLGIPTITTSNSSGGHNGYGLGYYDMLSNPYGFDGTLVHCGSIESIYEIYIGLGYHTRNLTKMVPTK